MFDKLVPTYMYRVQNENLSTNDGQRMKGTPNRLPPLS